MDNHAHIVYFKPSESVDSLSQAHAVMLRTKLFLVEELLARQLGVVLFETYQTLLQDPFAALDLQIAEGEADVIAPLMLTPGRKQSPGAKYLVRLKGTLLSFGSTFREGFVARS